MTEKVHFETASLLINGADREVVELISELNEPAVARHCLCLAQIHISLSGNHFFPYIIT